MHDLTATYSPDDNKLRLYAAHRLDAETFQRVKAAGFKWAPRQELFVAPAWTPAREDLLLDLCGEIGDEDTSLVDRAEVRAERFGGYHERRAADAAGAMAAVERIADGIPLGQPILIGHHSERRARKDAEKIERGMQRAVQMWDTAKYWEQRAAGAIGHAKYKELPAVRARRIKGLEADERKQQKIIDRARGLMQMWAKVDAPNKDGGEPSPELRRRRAVHVANHDGGYFKREHQHRSGYVGPLSLWQAAGGNIDDVDPETLAVATVDELQDRAISNHERSIAYAERWLAHLANRLAYERAMLAEAGGLEADRTKPEKGGAVRTLWGPRGGWAYIQRVNKVSVTVHHTYHDGGRVYRQTVPLDKLSALMTAAQVAEARAAGRIKETADGTGFYLLQSRDEYDADPRNAEPAPRAEAEPAPAAAAPVAEAIEAARDTLRNGGVRTVAAPQLFPTPRELARRVAELADIQPGNRILEPSAGTGALVEAAVGRAFGFDCCKVVAVEINPQLAEGLRERRARWLHANERTWDIRCADFLTLQPADLGAFNRIVMNPPFENGADIRHIEHARRFLRPGGRLVAICANGPRQRDRLQPIAAEWIDLPAGSFKASGTNVNTALVVLDAEPAAADEAPTAAGQLALL